MSVALRWSDFDIWSWTHTLGACNYLSTFWGNIYGSDCLIMALELVMKYELATRFLVQLNVVVARNCQRLPIGGEGMVGNWMVEQQVNLRSCHGSKGCTIGGALYYR
jgi:hypothetical protein